MKMSTKGRYAVMALIDIGEHSGGEPVSLAEIAQRQDISQEYLEQLFGKLRKAGLVESARGPGGRAGSSTAQRPTSFVCVRRVRITPATSLPRRCRNARSSGPVPGMPSGPVSSWTEARKRFGCTTGISAMKLIISSSSDTARASR